MTDPLDPLRRFDRPHEPRPEFRDDLRSRLRAEFDEADAVPSARIEPPHFDTDLRVVPDFDGEQGNPGRVLFAIAAGFVLVVLVVAGLVLADSDTPNDVTAIVPDEFESPITLADEVGGWCVEFGDPLYDALEATGTPTVALADFETAAQRLSDVVARHPADAGDAQRVADRTAVLLGEVRADMAIGSDPLAAFAEAVDVHARTLQTLPIFEQCRPARVFAIADGFRT